MRARGYNRKRERAPGLQLRTAGGAVGGSETDGVVAGDGWVDAAVRGDCRGGSGSGDASRERDFLLLASVHTAGGVVLQEISLLDFDQQEL